MKVLFLGSDEFSVNVLDVLLGKCNLCAVITSSPKQSGRGQKLTKSPVQVWAEEKNIDVYPFDKLKDHLKEIKNIDYDIALVASFGQILPEEFLSHKPCINVHPSLLPRYRGSSPIQSAILNGDKETGVTIMKVAKAVDSGDIILQEKVSLSGQERYGDLSRKLASLGGQLALKAIEMYENGSVKATKQQGEVVLVQKFDSRDGLLDFTQSAQNVYNRFRALGECVGCFFYINKQKIKVFDLKIVDENGKPNCVRKDKKRIIVYCKDKAIEILRLQSLSGKNVDSASFLNGFREDFNEVNSCLQI